MTTAPYSSASRAMVSSSASVRQIQAGLFGFE